MSQQPDNLPATAAPAQTPAKPEKKRRVSERMRQAIALVISGECKLHKEAAARVGMTAPSFARELKKPHVRVFYEQCARESVHAGVMRAAARLNHLVDAQSEHVSFDAAKHVLGIAGIKPASDAQVSVNVDIKAGFVIDLTPQRDGSNAKQIDQVGT